MLDMQKPAKYSKIFQIHRNLHICDDIVDMYKYYSRYAKNVSNMLNMQNYAIYPENY